MVIDGDEVCEAFARTRAGAEDIVVLAMGGVKRLALVAMQAQAMPEERGGVFADDAGRREFAQRFGGFVGGVELERGVELQRGDY